MPFRRHVTASLAQPQDGIQFSSRERPATDAWTLERLHSIIPLLSLPRRFPKRIAPNECKGQKLFRLMQTTRFLSAGEIRPEFVRLVGFLIPFIYDNLDRFAEAMRAAHGSPFFDFRVFSVVATIFGHFASVEHVDYASAFYLTVMRTSGSELILSVIAPFLCGLPSFRSIEAVMDKVVRTIGPDDRVLDPAAVNSARRKCTLVIAKAIVENLECLPDGVLGLLKEALKWLRQYILDMLPTSFVIPEGLTWMRAFLYIRMADFFAASCRELMSNAKQITRIVNAVFLDAALYRVPSLYTAFDQRFLGFGVTVADIVVAARAYGHVGKDRPYCQASTSASTVRSCGTCRFRFARSQRT